MEAPKIAQVPPEKPFLRADNPLVWIAGILVAGYAYKRYNEKQMNPRLPFELPVGADTIPKLEDNPCLIGASSRFSNPSALFSPGNPKIGAIWNFSLPAGSAIIDGKPFVTCPGRSDWCRQHCYARKGRFEFGNVKRKYLWNLQQTLKPDFAGQAIAELRTKKDKYVRVHVSGDFYSIPYINKWIAIAKALPDFKFYAYTRVWRVPKLWTALQKLRRLPNFEVMASTDPATGQAPAGVREAGIATVYRGKALPCRAQTEGVTCRQCLYCWHGKENVAFRQH